LKRYGERYPLGQKHLNLITSILDRSASWSTMLCTEAEVFKAVSISVVDEGSSRTTPSLMALHTPPAGGPPRHGTSGSGPDTASSSASFENLNMAYALDTSGYNVSSFSFDYDAMTEMFAGSETVFNGPDYMLK
jgi:hypothetical protein